MNCTYTFVHGRQKNRMRQNEGLVELLAVFEDGSKVYLSTGIYVAKSDWSKGSRFIKPDSARYKYVSQQLDLFRGNVERAQQSSAMWGPHQLRNYKTLDKDVLKPGTVNKNIQMFISNTHRVSDGARGNYLQALKKLNDHDPSIPVTTLLRNPMHVIISVDEYLFNLGLAPTTIDKLHSIYRKFFNQILKANGITGDAYYGWDFTGQTKSNVFLSEEEIENLENLQHHFLSHNESHSFDDEYKDLLPALDAFLLSYYTGVRYSDMNKLTMNNVVKAGDRKVFMFFPKKSTVHNKKPKKAIVPVTDKICSILDRYDWAFPVPSDDYIRTHIKMLCYMAGICDPFIYVKYSGKDAEQVTVPKYVRVTIHTARRSALNNMRKAGVPLEMIMRLTGHKTEAALLAYIDENVNEAQEIEELLSNQYFNQ